MSKNYHLLLSAKIGLLNNTDNKVYSLSHMRTVLNDREYDELVANIQQCNLPVESLQYASLELVELRRNIYCGEEVYLSVIVQCDPAHVVDMFLFYLDGFTVTAPIGAFKAREAGVTAAIDGYLSGDNSVIYRDGLEEFQLVLDDIRAVVYEQDTMRMVKGVKVMNYWNNK
jgi:hypothetical protein